MSQLDTLSQNRDAILLAEAIGWLHDYRKFSDEHLQVQAPNIGGRGLPRPELANHFSDLQEVYLNILHTSCSFLDLLNLQRNVVLGNILPDYLNRCHSTAHFDKRDPDDSGKHNRVVPQ